MGGTNSKLRKCLEIGDEESCLKLFAEHSQLIHNFNANEPMNELGESALHMSCKWSMPCLVKKLLYECNANPNRKNGLNQTALHLVCQIPVTSNEQINDEIHSQYIEVTSERRIKCLGLVLEWNRVCETNNTRQVVERVDVNGLDRNGNTALHLAAINGLMNCVEILVYNNCHLFIENESGDMACDLAAKYCHLNVLRYLEFNIVFSRQTNVVLSDYTNYCPKEQYFTLNGHDLEEAKNRLIVKTSNMLDISLTSAEVLLRSFDWSQKLLIDHWFNESEDLSKESHLNHKNEETVDSLEKISEKQTIKQFCEICSLDYGPNGTIGAKCGHQFCLNCWRNYLEMKIESRGTAAITCPAFNCSNLVSMKIIEKSVSPELTERVVRNDIEAFIESNPFIQLCPFPDCSKAVYLSESHLSSNEELSYILPNMPPFLPVSHAVDCGSGHDFCWECRREAHSPCDCKLWDDWIIKISDIKADELKQTYSQTEDAANSLWLVRNAKQCPRCKTYIQKTEGCNHLRCSKCKYDFCWICLESWRKHNSGTGGYFRCNRSDAVQRAQQNICVLKRVVEANNCQMKELKKFVFHYTKYKCNDISKESETALKERTNHKQKELFEYSMTLPEDNHLEKVLENDDFLCKAATELIRSRKVLCGCAVYGYYLEDFGYNKSIFEYMENNLNYCCNRLSEAINCDFLRKSRNYIIDSTNKVKIKRLELLSTVSKGLLPPGTPPGFDKHRGRQCLPRVLALDSMENLFDFCDENDKSLINQTMISSLSKFDDKNSWIRDRNGKHNNLLAIYDWPDDCDVDYLKKDSNERNNFYQQKPENSNSMQIDPEVCSCLLCTKSKAQNQRTGERHEFCSLKCKYMFENSIESNVETNYEYDSSMDLLLAIEMSKISFEEEIRTQSERQSFEMVSNNQMNKDNENPFESLVENLKTDPNINHSLTKNAVLFFLKSSFNDIIDTKNFNQLANELKTEKKPFSVVQTIPE